MLQVACLLVLSLENPFDLTHFAFYATFSIPRRIGYGFTITFGLPLITLPCREALLCIPEQIRAYRKDSALAHEYLDISHQRETGAHLFVNGVDFDEEKPRASHAVQHGVWIKPKSYGATVHKEDESAIQEDTFMDNEQPEQASVTDQHATPVDGFVIHFLSTCGIVVGCYIAAVLVPGVAIVWSICGSTVTFLIGFVIPTSCYLKIRSRKKKNPRSIAAWMLLVFFTVAMVVCTNQTLSNLASSA